MEYQVGNVCKHEYRKSGFYKVVLIKGNKVHLKRCRKDSNWSLADCKTTYVVDKNDPKLSIFDNGTYLQDIVDRNAPDAPFTINKPKKLDELSVWECSDNIKAEFRNLMCSMSPENLYCDGEASHAQARRTLAELNRKWALLEEYIGYKVVKEY